VLEQAGAGRGAPRRRLLRELRSPVTAVLLLAVVFAGIPLVAWLTPEQHVEVLGQRIGVGGQAPSPTASGPVQVVQLGSTSYDLRGVEVAGPLRPRLSLGPIRRSEIPADVLRPGSAPAVEAAAAQEIVGGFVAWYLWATLGVVAVALAASGLAGCVRVLAGLRRAARSGGPPPHLGGLAAGLAGSVGRMTGLAVVVALLAWGASGVAAYRGTVAGLRDVRSLSDLVGATTITPSPVGPPVFGYAGAVIGDSRVARVGGPSLPDPSPLDEACDRSADSAAAELALLRGERALNLACADAGIVSGLRGSQLRGGVNVPPQVGRLQQVQELDWVVVAIGPNDIGWSDFLLYCYGVPTCDDRLAEGEFDRRLTAFDRAWAALLADLAALPGAPDVVVVTSYDVLPVDPAPDCPVLRGPADVPGLDQRKAALLAEFNLRLNRVLTTGAERYGFAVAEPPLTPLCWAVLDGMGPDLQDLDDPEPFHPTAAGSLRLAAAVSAALSAAQALPRPAPED
jgi:hypothetical protein